MTKRQKEIHKKWCESENTTLYDVYQSFSQEKHDAYQKCRQECYSQGGSYFSIISYNKNMFTCGWITKIATGVVIFHYRTNKKSEEWIID